MVTHGDKAIRWIENFCTVPHGAERGQHVRLTEQQRDILRKFFDTDEEPPSDMTQPLASYLALLVVAGPRPLADCMTGINLDADVFTTWAAVGPDLKSVLRLDGGTIVCQELRTRFPPVAA